jgi:hypothetical protein
VFYNPIIFRRTVRQNEFFETQILKNAKNTFFKVNLHDKDNVKSHDHKETTFEITDFDALENLNKNFKG